MPALPTAPAAPSIGDRYDFFPHFPLLSAIKGRGDSWIFFFKKLFASLIGGQALPVGRYGPGRGQERERARCCPVFVCCLRMHSDGGMDHLGEAAGSRGAAALHYDREVRALSRSSAGPVGLPRESLGTSRPSPDSPQPIHCPLPILFHPCACVSE